MKSFNRYAKFFLIIILFSSCSSSKKTYYFSWRTAKVNVNESSNVSYLAIDSVTQSSPLQASTQHVPVDFPRHKFNMETQSNEQIAQPKIQKHVKPVWKELVTALLKQKSDTTRAYESKKAGDPKINKFAELGLLTVILGLITFVVGIFASSLPVLFVGGNIFFLGFIFSLVGLKSEKKKLAKAGVIICGVVTVGFLLAIFAVDVLTILRHD